MQTSVTTLVCWSDNYIFSFSFQKQFSHGMYICSKLINSDCCSQHWTRTFIRRRKQHLSLIPDVLWEAWEANNRRAQGDRSTETLEHWQLSWQGAVKMLPPACTHEHQTRLTWPGLTIISHLNSSINVHFSYETSNTGCMWVRTIQYRGLLIV